MGKKRNRNKSVQSDRHNEAVTIRHRLEQKLVRVDRSNNPITPSERKALTKAMIAGGLLKAPEAYYQPEPEIPKNVVSILEKMAPPSDTTPEASPKRSDYAAAVRERVKHEREVYARWAKTSADDTRNFSEGERYAWSMRFFSEMYESGKHRKEKDDEKLRQDIDASVAKKPALSLVHNSGIKRDPVTVSALNARNRAAGVPHKPVDTGGKTPSGLPISDFLNWNGAPSGKQSAVVYPTSTASNDDKQRTRSSSEWSAEHLLFRMIETTPQEVWPRQIMDYLYQDGDDWHVHTGMVRKAIKAGDDRVILKSVAIALLDGQETSSSTLRNKFVQAKREAIAAKKEVTALEYAYAQISGDISSAEQIKDEVKYDWTPQGARQSVREMEKQKYGTTYAKPPEDVDQALTEFKMFKQLSDSEGELSAYCRWFYGSKDYAVTMQEHADYLCAERQRNFDNRVRMLRLKRFFRQIPTMLKIQTDRDMARRHKATKTGDSQALKDFRRRAAKRNHVSSIYYSDLNICICSVDEQTTVKMSNAGIKPSVTLNGRVVGTSCSFKIVKRKPHPLVAPKPKPTAQSINKELRVQHWRNSNPDLIKEVGWWLLKYQPTDPTYMVDYRPCKGTLPTYDTSMGECRVRQSVIERWHRNADKLEAKYLASTTRGKFINGTVKAARKAWKLLNTNVDPASRKKDREAQAEKLRRKTYREEARAEQRAKNKAREEQRNEQARIKAAARAAFRTAH